MPFLLSRGGANRPLEVQRWQYFLLKQGFEDTGGIDGQFGLKTETATKAFQLRSLVPQTGELDLRTLGAALESGYGDRPDDYYDDKLNENFPPRPTQPQSPTNAGRNAALGCFRFGQRPLENRPERETIDILGSCDGALQDWEEAQIVDLAIPQKIFATGFRGHVRCHRLVAPHVLNLFQRWEEEDLLHLLRNFDGAFNPRYMRGESPGDGAQPTRRSDQVDTLSNHAFGSAFDVNAGDNPFRTRAALCPKRGAVRELVKPANAAGFFWGGHFGSRPDGMHFEFADFARL
jgi:hypothetical protein